MMGKKLRHKTTTHVEDQQDLLNGRNRSNFPAQWERLGDEVVNAQHRQARNLIERGYGAVDWVELTGQK